MRFLLVAAALATVSTAAYAQGSSWGVFEAPDGSRGAGVQAPNGAQLLVKCDKPGEGEVYGILVSPEELVGPSNRGFQMRPVELRFDEGAPVDDRWRFYESSASAVHKGTENQLDRLLAGLADAKTFRARLNPERARWVEMTFDVTGARAAIAQVYENCEDTNPLG